VVDLDTKVRLADGVSLFVRELGDGFPLIVLHGGPGLDHSMFRPYLDPLGDEFRLLYVDERGQGRSDRVDPATLSLEVFARDVDLLAQALGLDRFALLGHSFGAIVTTKHATALGTAAAYVVSGGADSSDPSFFFSSGESGRSTRVERKGPISRSRSSESCVIVRPVAPHISATRRSARMPSFSGT